MKTILIINPGSTSTKVALYECEDSWDVKLINQQNITQEKWNKTYSMDDQLAIRTKAVEVFLIDSGRPHLDIIAARGGLTHPVEAGSYAVNAAMKEDFINERYGSHASNFGALIADKLAQEHGIQAMITDPVGVDQFPALARYSGHPELPRRSQLHALNMRAVAREAARDIGGRMEDFRFIIAHLGGGISISPMEKGLLLDTNHAIDGGPFSPQRSGGLPLRLLVKMCFSGRWKNAEQALEELTKRSGLIAYLGTDDGREIKRRAIAGEQPWREVYEAMAYQISKEIAAMAAVLHGKVDCILLTGGLPHPPLSDWISSRVSWIAPLRIYPGEKEMLALARAAARYIFGEEELKKYIVLRKL